MDCRRSNPLSLRRNELRKPENVQDDLQACDWYYLARLLPEHHLVANRRIKDLWIPEQLVCVDVNG